MTVISVYLQSSKMKLIIDALPDIVVINMA